MTYRNGPNRRDRWKVRVQKDRKLAAETRLFLVATLAPKMKADGKVSQPRRNLAAAAGVSERMITKYIKQAKDAGWLVVVQPGYRSMTAVYQASFPDWKEGTHEFSLSEPESGNYKDPLCAGTHEFPHSPEESGNYRVPTTSSSTTRRVVAVGNADRTQHQDSTSHRPSRRCVVRLGLAMNECDDAARTNCRTQARTVERHRPHVLDAARWETRKRHSPSNSFRPLPNTTPTKGAPMNRFQPRGFCCPGTRGTA